MLCIHSKANTRYGKKILDEFGRINILVNNTVREVLSPIVDTTEESWDLVMNVTLKKHFDEASYMVGDVA